MNFYHCFSRIKEKKPRRRWSIDGRAFFQIQNCLLFRGKSPSDRCFGINSSGPYGSARKNTAPAPQAQKSRLPKEAVML
jgi:hypothetical protein